MKTIKSLDQLLETLPQCSGQEYVDIARNMEIPLEDFRPYAFFASDTYTRNCIDRREGYELLLLCWEEGQETPVHCHGGEECWVYTLLGKIQEYRVEEREDGKGLRILRDEMMHEGGISYMNDNMGFHSLHNRSKGRAMTLHLYMNPIDRCRVYDESKGKFEYTELEYHSENGEPVSDELTLASL